MKRKEILEKAAEIVCGHREQDYGSPEDNFTMIADLWSVWLGVKVTAIDVTMMMGLMKTARIKTGTMTEDSFIDLAGYAACGGEIASTMPKVGILNEATNYLTNNLKYLFGEPKGGENQ